VPGVWTLRRFAAVTGLVALACAVAPAARALPVPQADKSHPAATPTPPPADIAYLPVGSPLYFVLDDGLSSARSRPGDVVHMHLRDALLLNGAVIAPAGSPATMTIVQTHHAASGDNDGSIQISLSPLVTPQYGALPIRAINEFLTIEHTAGELSTRDTTDTVIDIFEPTYIIWQALRKGHEYVLQPGTVLRALTAAAVDARDPGKIAIVNPQPLMTGGEVPHAAITESPFYTPVPMAPAPPRRGHGAPPPTAAPSPNGTGGVVPSPGASLAPGPVMLTAPPAVTVTAPPGAPQTPPPAVTLTPPPPPAITPVPTGPH